MISETLDYIVLLTLCIEQFRCFVSAVCKLSLCTQWECHHRAVSIGRLCRHLFQLNGGSETAR
jgi:hypothetical protein